MNPKQPVTPRFTTTVQEQSNYLITIYCRSLCMHDCLVAAFFFVRPACYNRRCFKVPSCALARPVENGNVWILCILEQSLSRGASQLGVRRRWLSLCTVWPLHSQWPSEQINLLRQCAYPFYSSRASFFGKASHYPGLAALLQPRFGSLRLLDFPKTKIAVERDICECDGHIVRKLSQRRLTADW